MKASLLACLFLTACTNNPGRPHVRIANVATGLQTQFMPVTLADTLGFYKDEGLEVTMENLPSSAKTLQALVGGSVDVGGLVFALDIQMAADGQPVRSFFVINRLPTIVLVASPKAIRQIRSVEDLKGAVIGIPSPGSANHQWLNFYLSQHGLRPNDVSTVNIGIGASAIAAMESGRIDAASLSGGDHLRLLRRDPSMRVLVDGSTPESVRQSFGGDLYAGATLSAKQGWLERNPDTARRLARATQRSLQWIATHTPAEIREHLPEESRSRDAAVDIEIIRWGLATYTPDGAMPKDAPAAIKRFLDVSIPKVWDSKINLATTWTNEYLPGAK